MGEITPAGNQGEKKHKGARADTSVAEPHPVSVPNLDSLNLNALGIFVLHLRVLFELAIFLACLLAGSFLARRV